MGFFDLFKNSTTGEVWRNKSGKIACPGDRCPKECDSTCPIYLNTQAIQLMITGNSLGAIPLYEEAVKIAPDFYDAWNNMAALYGDSRNFEKAYECYIKAHECAPNKPQPLFGLALAQAQAQGRRHSGRDGIAAPQQQIDRRSDAQTHYAP